jgi:IS30 family transposase
MPIGKPLTGEQRSRVLRLLQQNYPTKEIQEITGFAKSTIQRIMKETATYPEGYVHRPRKIAQEKPKKSWIERLKALFGIGTPEPAKKRRPRKPKKEIGL